MHLDPRGRRQLLVLWIIWGTILGGLVGLYLIFARQPLPSAARQGVAIALVGFVEVFVSVIIRWLVVPRITGLVRLLPMFIIGIALAEGCGVVGIFLGGAYRDSLFVLGVLGVTQYVPLFARRLLEPKGSGFIPNN